LSISRNSVIDETTSHLTKAASCQVIGYPAKAGIQMIKYLSRKRDNIKNLSASQSIFYDWIPAFAGMTV
jgi:hypothetical protein